MTGIRPEYGQDYLLIFVGYTGDAEEAAELIAGMEQPLQRELDKLRRVNPNIPFNRIKMWKWDSDAVAISGGQDLVITPHLERADIAVFVFNARVGAVSWKELNHAINKKPPIAVMPFFKATPPPQDSLNDEKVAEDWVDVLKKIKSLAAGWTDPETKALAPLPKYNDLTHLDKIAIDRLNSEVVRLASVYAWENEKKARKSIPKNIKGQRGFMLGVDGGTNSPYMYEDTGNVLSIVPSGKERYLHTVIPNLVNYTGAVLILDPTGEIYRATAEKRAEFSEILKLDPWSLAPDSKIGSLNPIDILLQIGLSINDSAKLLTELMIPYTEYRNRRRELLTTDPFWTNQQRKFLTALIHLAISESQNNEAILTKVRNILHEDDLIYNLAARMDTNGSSMDSELRQELAYFLQQPESTRAGIIAGVSQFFMALGSSKAQLSTNVSTIDTKKWVNNEAVTVYLIGPPAGISAFDSVYRAWLGSLLFPVLIRPRKEAKSILMVLDVDESFEQWHGMSAALTQGRNCRIWTIVSDLSDLDNAFEDASDAVLNSFSVIQALRPNNFAAASALSRLIGLSIEKILAIDDSEVILSVNGGNPVVLTLLG
jgi:type IV secretion system protein VirD4